MSGEEPEKPSGYSDPSGTDISEMVGNSWPGTDKKHFDDRHAELDRAHRDLTGAREGWQAGQLPLRNGNDWAGTSANVANAKADTHTTSMEGHERQLADAKTWSHQAGDLIVRTKNAIVHNVGKAVEVMNDTKGESEDGKITGEAAANIRTFTRLTNEDVNQWAADTVRGKKGISPDPPSLSKEDIRNARDKREGGEGQPGDDPVRKDNPVATFANASFVSGPKVRSSEAAPSPDVEQSSTPPTDSASFVSDPKVRSSEAAPSPDVEQSSTPPTDSASFVSDPKVGSSEAAPVIVQQVPPATPGKAAPPLAPGVPAPAPSGGAPNLPGPSVGGAGAPSAPSPLSGGLGSGMDQAASASQAVGQAPVGAAPTDPLQAFSKGFADSAGTPVHAASTGAPPLAPAPAVPASDAMAPASTHSAPTALTGAQPPAAPVQGPPAGGSMGMGGGMPSMPLGPPPTAPPAAPVAPPPAVASPPSPPANIGGGAQIAPIPVSAARAERDAAQNAAKRSGSDPLVLARRIAAALNAPDMVDAADYRFFWVTAVTMDGSIVVANNYGLAYIPERVRLPEQVKMASADESISPAERASCVTQPVAALHRWANHHGTELRAVIATEDQLKNSDAGVHHEVLTPEDIPASGKMVGRDRLQVIAPQAASQLMRISDGDLVNVLPPAPVDTAQPEDRRTMLWYKVWEPLISRSAKRDKQHLQALLEYAVHAQEQAIYAGHTATQSEDQRRAVGDFVYWQHVGQLIADALVELEVATVDQDQKKPTG
ncbi:hypothetical protein [Mycolicibacterium peregrinum]|uniref:hypothetical protein n=1 Tax=Mycolicibacterium peregrinum TaxID=43304 RepID=UPI0021F3947C|nr:hypothetical protein [Mycolicibacterium peregrinum]